MTTPFTRERRAELLSRHAAALSAYEAAMARAMAVKRYTEEEQASLQEAERHFRGVRQVEEEYFQALPRVPLSLCPFDGVPLVRSFDPFGLDGLWWRGDATPAEPPACRHFCVLTGALDLAGQPPRGGAFEAHVGPAVPFVIPRLLSNPEMAAVLSRVPLENGYRAYLVAYFADRRPPPQDLTANWPRTQHLYLTQLGEVEWQTPSERLDYDLRPWLDRSKLRWCIGGSAPEWVVKTGAESCPYIDLPGERLPRILQGDEVRVAPSGGGRVVVPVR